MSKKHPISALGRLIRHWRRLRGMSQEELATKAGLSTRHLSRVETGRAQATRESVLWISEALELPRSERAAFMEAADFVGEYQPVGPDAPHDKQVMGAVVKVLTGHEPFPAFSHNHQGQLLATNATFEWLMDQFLGYRGPADPQDEGSPIPRDGALTVDDAKEGHVLLFGPDGLRKNLLNWSEFALFYVRRVHAELVRGGTTSPELRRLFDWLVAETGLDPVEAAPARSEGTSPALRWHLHREQQTDLPALDIDLHAVTVTLGTPQDQSLRDVRIVLMYPNDAATETVLNTRDEARDAN